MSATNKHRTATIDAMAHRERLRFITPLQRAATRKFCRRIYTDMLKRHAQSPEYMEAFRATAIAIHNLSLTLEELRQCERVVLSPKH